MTPEKQAQVERVATVANLQVETMLLTLPVDALLAAAVRLLDKLANLAPVAGPGIPAGLLRIRDAAVAGRDAVKRSMEAGIIIAGPGARVNGSKVV
jgi:hypothetical protein